MTIFVQSAQGAASLRVAMPPDDHRRRLWIGGHGTDAYEQKTQQSPGSGRSSTPQPEHS
jgi:hypothetical protein